MAEHEAKHLELPTSGGLMESAPASEIVQAEFAVEVTEVPASPPRRRRIVLPTVLFLLTCASTFFVGAVEWEPEAYLFSGTSAGAMELRPDPFWMVAARRAVLVNWRQGLTYMACLVGILLTHEMGHFVMALAYRVRASLPYFLPLPITLIGTMGAVIGMDGSTANRRQIFDIGLAGPLAGLLVAVPIMWIGVQRLDLSGGAAGGMALELPLAMRLAVDYLQPGAYDPAVGVPVARVNAFFMAGWVGLLITALNMLPVSQLDGGHVAYALFGRAAHWVARAFMLAAFLYMGIMFALYRQFPGWILMALLVLLMGVDHPRTRDDSVPLGWFRVVLGAASLLIPIFCFMPNPAKM